MDYNELICQICKCKISETEAENWGDAGGYYCAKCGEAMNEARSSNI